ncbi:hypothetical protein LG489_001415 [Listeria monocytogenes]|uniref:phage structural protein n=1 Tax=Listeria monocytogenes TaxID=1639 RepID=UPI00098E2A79|nr:hypothetical protein [Listeria monocytogenes]EAE5980034.1 hypothetical protein [Listeria monocytogenes]EAE9448819.1 hypothetical protein [Listeria monocytogenes]EAG6795705.1 hypothetical protein [Listeria monocytogenes]EHZ7830322.1 hypothetical protein [Listeria monocytogenes]EII3173792.1 hypothetical protein [Listeria monocytogenes]
MNEVMATYDANTVSTIINGISIFGFSDGDMVSCSKDSNNVEIKSDAQGNSSAAVNNDKMGTIKVDLAQTSPCYPKLIDIANRQLKVPIYVINGKEKIGGSMAFIEKLPDAGFGKSVGTRSFTFKVLDYTHTA